MEQHEPVKVLEQFRVSPPPGFTIPQTPLPLSFFDIQWLPSPPGEILYFYPYHHPKSYFMHTTFPNIRHSLSLTLQHFYPLAGTLTWPPESPKPQISFNEDNFSVILTLAESNQNFDEIVGNNARYANDFHPLAPEIPSSKNSKLEVEVPLLALQVTLFPDNGICIGISILHVIGDGNATSHFMKSLASVCRSLGDASCLLPESLPFYDRTVIKDPDNLEGIYLNQLAKFHFSPRFFYYNPTKETGKVLATFILSQTEVQKIKKWVLDRFDEIDTYKKPLHVSTFVITCAYMWFCLVKVLESGEDRVDEGKRDFLKFAVECRQRLDTPIPTTYFGNCLTNCGVEIKTNDLIGKDGLVVAVSAIGNAVQKVISNGVLAEAKTTMSDILDSLRKGRVSSFAGSPKLGFYSTDFGWGMAKKINMLSSPSYICESQNGDGGVEFGLVLKKIEMDAFASLFADTLKVLS